MLHLHMQEALQPDALADADAQAWLDISDNVVENTVVNCAAVAFGPTNMVALAKRHW